MGDTPKERAIQSLLRTGGKIMAAGKQYYKYKRKAELLDELLFDIQTILMSENNYKGKAKLLNDVFLKYRKESTK